MPVTLPCTAPTATVRTLPRYAPPTTALHTPHLSPHPSSPQVFASLLYGESGSILNSPHPGVYKVIVNAMLYVAMRKYMGVGAGHAKTLVQARCCGDGEHWGGRHGMGRGDSSHACTTHTTPIPTHTHTPLTHSHTSHAPSPCPTHTPSLPCPSTPPPHHLAHINSPPHSHPPSQIIFILGNTINEIVPFTAYEVWLGKAFHAITNTEPPHWMATGGKDKRE